MELAQPRVDTRGDVDSVEDRVDRTVAAEGALELLSLRATDADLGVRSAACGGLYVEPLERVADVLSLFTQLVREQRLEVHRRDLLLLVSDLLEALERLVQRL